MIDCPLCKVPIHYRRLTHSKATAEKLAMHLMEFHQGAFVGVNRLIAGHAATLCWCGSELQGTGYQEYAKHLIDVGGLEACLLKAALGN